MRDKLINASMLKFEAQRAEAATNLLMYLERPSAIAEHPNVVEEVTKLVKSIAEADECIKILEGISNTQVSGV